MHKTLDDNGGPQKSFSETCRRLNHSYFLVSLCFYNWHDKDTLCAGYCLGLLTKLVAEPVTQMAVELIKNHLISVQQKK